MGEIAPFGRPEPGPRASEARKVTGPHKTQRGGLLFRIGLLLALLIPAAFASPWYVAYAAPLPDVSQLDSDVPGDTLVYAADGTTVIADLHPPGYQHYYETLPEMGAFLPQAIVAIEDRNFYSEPGIDPAGIARAAVVDLKARSTVQGASTITQQLVKVRLLGDQPSLQRKLTEALLAFAVERRYSKDRILEMYLNSVSFGNSAVGAGAAAEIYFHRRAADLDLAQASMLAGLVRGPTLYSPFTSWSTAKARQQQVLQAMVDAGKVTQAQAEAAYKEDLKPPAHMFTPVNAIIAPGFVSYVTGQLTKQYGKGATYGGALRVYTTLNVALQGIAQDAITSTQANLAWRNVQQGALVAIDPTSGAIIAMVSSANPRTDGGQYNLAVWPPRNPGSSMKMFTYTAAIASTKFTMTTPVQDGPFEYMDPGSQTLYRPQNYDGTYHGTCQLQVCMGNSLNIPAVKVELGVGIPNVVDVARAMGAPPWQPHPDGSFSNNDDPNSFGPSLTLGGYGETPLQMATGASVLAARGVLHQPFAIARVISGGATIYQHTDSARQAVDPRVAFIMATMMSKDENRAMIFGRNSQLVIPGWQVAVKTGTSDSFADAWTVGFTPKIAVAVWMGNPDWRQKMTEGSDSYYVAVPAWHSFLARALPVLGAEQWYAVPAGVEYQYGNYYLPGTVPTSPPVVNTPPAPTGGGSQKKKKEH